MGDIGSLVCVAVPVIAAFWVLASFMRGPKSDDAVRLRARQDNLDRELARLRLEVAHLTSAQRALEQRVSTLMVAATGQASVSMTTAGPHAIAAQALHTAEPRTQAARLAAHPVTPGLIAEPIRAEAAARRAVKPSSSRSAPSIRRSGACESSCAAKAAT